MAIYDVNGNAVGGDGGSGDFGITELKIYNDGTSSERQGVLTYSGHKLYPINYNEQRRFKKKVYDGGLLLALGDSYTDRNSKFDTFAEERGLICDNLGLASSTIAGSADGSTVGFHAFWKRLDDEISSFPKTIDGVSYDLSDVKLITFMGGANDWWTVNEEVNRLGDPTSTDKEQLYGACKYIFETFSTTFPNADIICILQPSNAASGTSNYAMWLKEGIVRNCAEMYHIPICDCIFDWYSPVNPNDLSKYWKEDHLHLSADGNTALFTKLGNTLDALPYYRA